MANNKNITNRFSLKKIVITLIILLILAVLVEGFISYAIILRDTKNSTTLLLNQIENLLQANQESENDRLQELKSNYMMAARSASYIIEQDPALIDDMDELGNIADMLSVDELHIFDETGKIYAGTNPEYYGMSFSSGEQIAYFKTMLEDKTLSMCQDITPNTASGKKMMYAIVWSSDGTKMIQVGVEPKRLLTFIENHGLGETIKKIPINKGFIVYGVELDSKTVIASTDFGQVDTSVPQDYVGLFNDGSTNNGNQMYIYNGSLFFCNYRLVENYAIAVAYDMSNSMDVFVTPLVIIAVYIFLAEAFIMFLFIRLRQTEEQKTRELEDKLKEITELHDSLSENHNVVLKQYSILQSMADIYFSMHLINLKDYTVEVLSDRGMVRKIVNKTVDADKMMREVMTVTTVNEYVDKALEFSDLTTVAQRMKDKKIITAEFVGKSIGWYSASFITVEKDEEGYPTKVLYAVRCIDELKKKEESLIHKSNTDELTGCLNRRAYEEQMDENEKNAPEEDFVYISIDVNGLKTTNDTLGHAAGDELIIGACACIRECIGEYGNLYRTGGDEFVALINMDKEALEALDAKFEAVTGKWQGERVKTLALAWGAVSRSETPVISVREMAKLADRRMYDCKSRYYRKQGFDRRGQRDAHVALCASYTKILKINVTDDTYRIVNMDLSEQIPEKGFNARISTWMNMFGEMGNVHQNDLKEYLEKVDRQAISRHFKESSKPIHIFYRRKYEDGFKRVMMEIIPAEDYSNDNQNLYLYVKDIDE